MKKLSDYFTIKNILKYIGVSFCVGFLFNLPVLITAMFNPNISIDWLKYTVLTFWIISFVFVFLLALLLYGLAKLLVSKSGKSRKIIRLIYSLLISIIGGLIISLGMLETVSVSVDFKIVCFLIAAGILFVISNLFFKRIQDKEESVERYYKY